MHVVLLLLFRFSLVGDVLEILVLEDAVLLHELGSLRYLLVQRGRKRPGIAEVALDTGRHIAHATWPAKLRHHRHRLQLKACS